MTSKINFPMDMEKFFIKAGYKCNLDKKDQAIPYLDTVESSSSYQDKVYQFCHELIKKYKLKNVLDIGCGFGIKLKKYIYPICQDIVGIDTEHSIKFCKEKYAFGKWNVDDIESPTFKLKRKFDLIISADVIEHLMNPDNLLSFIRAYAHRNTLIVISTPERDLVRGKDTFGPPENICHVREWNMPELNSYVHHMDFQILKHFVVRPRKNVEQETCQIILCQT